MKTLFISMLVSTVAFGSASVVPEVTTTQTNGKVFVNVKNPTSKLIFCHLKTKSDSPVEREIASAKYLELSAYETTTVAYESNDGHTFVSDVKVSCQNR